MLELDAPAMLLLTALAELAGSPEAAVAELTGPLLVTTISGLYCAEPKSWSVVVTLVRSVPPFR